MKIQSYRSTGSVWDYSHHKMGFTLPSSLASTFPARPADSKPPQEAYQSSVPGMKKLLNEYLLNEWHPSFTKGLTQDLAPLQELRESGLLGHTISNGWCIQSFQGHTHVSHALGRPKKMGENKYIRWMKPPRLDPGFSRLVCYKEHGLEQQTNLSLNCILVTGQD